MPILAKYRSKYRCFNDDIQGTGCVTLAGVLAAARQAKLDLTQMSFLCAGAGSAGLGVCAQIVDGMVEAGLTRDEARKRFVVCTSVDPSPAPEPDLDPNPGDEALRRVHVGWRPRTGRRHARRP